MEYLLFIASKVEPIFYKIVYMSLIASIIGLAIFVIRKLLRKKISAKWISFMWLILIVSLVVPISLKSKISIYSFWNIDIESKFNNINYAQEAVEQETLKEFVVEEYEQDKAEINILEKFELEDEIQKFNKENRNYILEMLPVVWLIIVLILFILYILTYIVFEIKIHKSEKIKDEKINDILNICKQKLEVKKKIKIVKQSIINMPSIFGIFNIRILINDELLKLSNKEIEYVLMHEVAHYKRKDNLLNVLITILRCIYIFNPIIFILLNKVKKDLELATDELAMEHSGKEEQKEYCKTLVMLSNLNSDKFLIQTLCLTDEKKNLERRIDNVKLLEKFKKHKKIIAFCSGLLIIFLILIFFSHSSGYMSKKDITKLMDKNSNRNNYILEITQIENSTKTKVIYKTLGNVTYSETFYQYNDMEEEINSIWYSDRENVINIYPEGQKMYIYKFNEDENYSLLPSSDYIKYSQNYKFCGEESFDGKDVYVIENQPESNYNYDSNLNKFVKNTTSSKMWIEKETGLLLKTERNYISDSDIEDYNLIEIYDYKFDVLNESDIVKPNIYEYQDYKIDVQFKEFEEVKALANKNVNNEKAIKDMQDIESLDQEKFKYRYDHFLEIFDGKYVYNVSYNDYTTGEYYKFVINYDDNLVRYFEKNIINENGEITNSIIEY